MFATGQGGSLPDKSTKELSLPPLFSADSHVVEGESFWDGILPDGYMRTGIFYTSEGAVDPEHRLEEQAKAGVDGEVLYPSYGLRLFGLEDSELQERCFQRYNNWLSEFCQVDSDHLIGVGLIAAYDIDHAVKELERCKTLGLRGCMLWQTPPAGLSYMGRHYDPLWEAAQSLEIPVSFHTGTGFNYSKYVPGPRAERDPDPLVAAINGYRSSVNQKTAVVFDLILDIMFSGVMDRFPDLKLLIVENEISWLPYLFHEYDDFRTRAKIEIEKTPFEYFGSQLFATIFRDKAFPHDLAWWEHAGIMWSNDFPHPGSTWPDCQEFVADQLGFLPPEILERTVRGLALDLYGMSA